MGAVQGRVIGGRDKGPAWIRRRPIAHRGLHDETRPENSLPAIEAAVEAGYPVEIDVHATRDDGVVVFHDDTLTRMTGVSGDVAARSSRELRQLRLSDTHATIPTLAEALAAVAGRVPVVVELKNTSPVGRLEAAVHATLADYDGPIAVQAFNPLRLAWFRRRAPAVPRGLLATDFAKGSLPVHQRVLLRRLALAPLVAPSYVGYELRCLPYWAPTMVRRVGIPVVAWTVRTPSEVARARAVADNLIFEHVRP